MKILLLILFICPLFLSGYTQKVDGERKIRDCADTLTKLPAIGSPFNKNSFDNWGLLLVSSSQILPSRCFVIENVNYEIGLSSSNFVEYIGTSDPNFITTDSITVNNTLKDLITKFQDHLHAEPGFGWIFNLPCDWSALIIESYNSYGITRPDDNKKISCLFKRQ